MEVGRSACNERKPILPQAEQLPVERPERGAQFAIRLFPANKKGPDIEAGAKGWDYARHVGYT